MPFAVDKPLTCDRDDGLFPRPQHMPFRVIETAIPLCDLYADGWNASERADHQVAHLSHQPVARPDAEAAKPERKSSWLCGPRMMLGIPQKLIRITSMTVST